MEKGTDVKKNSVETKPEKQRESVPDDKAESKSEETKAKAETAIQNEDFEIKDGLKLLLNLNVALSSKVDTFNSSLSSLTKCTYKIDDVLVDVERRLRKIEGRDDSEDLKSFLPGNALPSDIIRESMKGFTDQPLSQKDLIQGTTFGDRREKDSLKSGGSLVRKGEGKFITSPSAEGSKTDSQGQRRASLKDRKFSVGTADALHGAEKAQKAYAEGADIRKAGRGDISGEGHAEGKGDRSSLQDRNRFESRPKTKRVATKKLKKIPIKYSPEIYRKSLTIPISKCKTCGEEVEKNEDLVTVLLHVEPKQYPTDGGKIACRICGFSDPLEETMRNHVYNHIKNSELCHSAKCHKRTSVQSTGAIHDILNTELDQSVNGKIFSEAPSIRERDSSILRSLPDKDVGKVQELITLQTVLALDQRPARHSRVDKYIAPCCANCNRLFSYNVPMVKKVLEPYPCKTTPRTKYAMKHIYVCLVCGMKKPYREHIELHAMGHVENNELYCKDCPKPNINYDVVPQDREKKISRVSRGFSVPPSSEPNNIVTALREHHYFEQTLTSMTASIG